MAIFLALSMLHLACCAASTHAIARVEASEATPIQVFVFQSADHSYVPGARVFVVGANGRELFSTLSDASGVATLPVSLEDLQPRYVFAELPPFYVTGAPWTNGSREYNLPMQVIGTVDRATVKAQ